MSHWPEMSDGGDNDATVDRVSGDLKIIAGVFSVANGELSFTCTTQGVTLSEVLDGLTKLRDEIDRQIRERGNCPYNDAQRTDAPASAPTPPTQCASIGPDWRERSTGRLMRGCRCLLPDGHEGQHTCRHYEAFKAGAPWVPPGPPWAPPDKGDTWGDAPASEASAPPPNDAVLCRVLCRYDREVQECRWHASGERWIRGIAPMETGWRQIEPANLREQRLAERLAAVEAEVAARVERAYREGYGHGWTRKPKDDDLVRVLMDVAEGEQWLTSRARAELNERERGRRK